MLRKPLLFVTTSLLVFSVYYANANTIISTTSGTFTHGGTVTISGNNFGMKSPVVPLHWDNMEDKAVDSVAAVAAVYRLANNYAQCHNTGPTGYAHRYKNVNSERWIPPPHPHSTKILGTAIHDTYELGNNYCSDGTITIDNGSQTPDWFFMAYMKYSSDWPSQLVASRTYYDLWLDEKIDSSTTSFNIRGNEYEHIWVDDTLEVGTERLLVQTRSGQRITVQRGWGGTTPVSHSKNDRIYALGRQYNQKFGTMQTSESSFGKNDVQIFGLLDKEGRGYHDLVAGYGQSICNPCPGSWTTLRRADIRSEWKHIEISLRNDTAWFKTLVDNAVSMNCTCSTPPYMRDMGASGPRSISIGAWFRYFAPLSASSNYHGCDRCWVYFDDVYVDTTFSRVMLANNANYQKATIIEPQIPTAWSETSVTVTVNLGKLPGTGKAYVFVFDAENKHNTIGYPIIIVQSLVGDSSVSTSKDIK